MTTIQTIAERREAGRQARQRAARSQNAITGNVDRDPVQLLKENSAGRVEALVPLRYGRMSVSPFTFFRGSAILQAHDLAGTENTGITFPVCGDGVLAVVGPVFRPEKYGLAVANGSPLRKSTNEVLLLLPVPSYQSADRSAIYSHR